MNRLTIGNEQFKNDFINYLLSESVLQLQTIENEKSAIMTKNDHKSVLNKFCFIASYFLSTS